MRHGLWISLAGFQGTAEAVSTQLVRQDIPLAGFTDEPARLFDGNEDRYAFLFRISEAIFRGETIPAQLVMNHLSGDALPGNVLRRYLEWQQNLLPYLNRIDAPVDDEGCFALGESLLCCPLTNEGAADALLPPGQWTDVITGEVFEGSLRRLRSPNAMPLLAAEGAVIPTGDPACPTLHWYQAPEDALGLMHREPYHLILHRNGMETCLR